MPSVELKHLRLPEMRTETTRPSVQGKVSGKQKAHRRTFSIQIWKERCVSAKSWLCAYACATYSNDTGHDHRDDTLHHEIRAEDTHSRDTDL